MRLEIVDAQLFTCARSRLLVLAIGAFAGLQWNQPVLMLSHVVHRVE